MFHRCCTRGSANTKDGLLAYELAPIFFIRKPVDIGCVDCFLNPVNNQSLRIVVNKRHSLDGLCVSYPLSLFLHVL